MASIAWEGKDGNVARIAFRDAGGRQQSLRLGRTTKRTAQNALMGFERLVESRRVGSTIHPDALRWLEGLDDSMHDRVARLGLVEPRQGASTVTLGELLARFESAATVKASTRAAYRQTTESLRMHFGADVPVRSITPADADAWRKAIAEPMPAGSAGPHPKRLAPATVAKRVHVARSIFKRAIRWGLLSVSPFEGLKAGSQSNPDRAYYVSREAIQSILAECPDAEWRAIVALSRFGGLRFPSEVALLRWGDLNWERGRMTVRSPKTAHHEGHGIRLVPIAPELRPILQELFDRAPIGEELVLPRLSDPRANLRTHFRRIIARAGLKPWPRLFHNMRASCTTDWAERFPNHVAAKWAGHSPLIAAQHYLQTRDVHFDLAAGFGEAATNPATQALAHAHTGRDAKDNTPRKPVALAGCVTGCDPMMSEEMGDTGFELPRKSSGISGDTESGDNESGNSRAGQPSPQLSDRLPDSDLVAVMAAWSRLSPVVRAGIVALVRASAESEGGQGDA